MEFYRGKVGNGAHILFDITSECQTAHSVTFGGNVEQAACPIANLGPVNLQGPGTNVNVKGLDPECEEDVWQETLESLGESCITCGCMLQRLTGLTRKDLGRQKSTKVPPKRLAVVSCTHIA